MFDLLVKNAVLPNGRSGVDIGCKGDRIAAVERDISAEARQVIEAEGCLLAPPFVDSAFSYGRHAFFRHASDEYVGHIA